MAATPQQIKRLALGFGACVLLILPATQIHSAITNIVGALALICAAVTGWRLVFEGATIISHRLEGVRRRVFNYTVALLIPAVASLWFLRGVNVQDIGPEFVRLASPWPWIILGILVAIAWSAADQIDRQHFSRGLLIAATALWIIHAAPAGTWLSSDDDAGYEDSEDDAQPNPAAQFVGFVTQTALVYGAIILKLSRPKV